MAADEGKDSSIAEPEKYYIHRSKVQEYSCFCSQTLDEGRNYERLPGSHATLAACNEAIRKNKTCTKTDATDIIDWEKAVGGWQKVEAWFVGYNTGGTKGAHLSLKLAGSPMTYIVLYGSDGEHADAMGLNSILVALSQPGIEVFIDIDNAKQWPFYIKKIIDVNT